MKTITLITGGSRSGKSRYALELAEKYTTKTFIATAQPFDEEMRARIAKHQEERDSSFVTIEEPINLGKAFCSLPANTEVVVVDCLTVWLGNLMHRAESDTEDYPEVTSFLNVLEAPPCDLILVSNEVGMGIIPDNRLSRRFKDLAGNLNQEVAKQADKVVLMVSGCALNVK